MNRAARQLDRPWGLGVLIALLALMVGVVTPPGFMVASRGKAPALVICTGHGPLATTGGTGIPDQPDGKVHHDGACPFAGHGIAVAPVPAGAVLVFRQAPVAAPDARVADLAPGRGLAAPPPQSHAPPVLI